MWESDRNEANKQTNRQKKTVRIDRFYGMWHKVGNHFEKCHRSNRHEEKKRNVENGLQFDLVEVNVYISVLRWIKCNKSHDLMIKQISLSTHKHTKCIKNAARIRKRCKTALRPPAVSARLELQRSSQWNSMKIRNTS